MPKPTFDVKTDRLHEIVLQGYTESGWQDVRVLKQYEYRTPMPPELLSEAVQAGCTHARTMRRNTHPVK